MQDRLTRRHLLAAGAGAVLGVNGRASETPPSPPPEPLPACGNPHVLLNEARERYDEGKTKLQDAWRESVAKALSLADKVEVHLLDFEPSIAMGLGDDPFADSDGKQFPIYPYQKATRILKSLTAKEPDAKDLIRLTAAMLKAGDSGAKAACHHPIHGLRFLKGDTLLYETSLCWECGNYYVQYPDDYNTAHWLGLEAPELEKRLKELMPIPASELKRFKDKFKSDK